MDKDLKDVIIYGGGAIILYGTFIGFINHYLKDNNNYVIIYTLFLTIFLWLSYLQIRINKKQNGGKNDKR